MRFARAVALTAAVCSVLLPVGLVGAGADGLPFGIDAQPGVQPGGPLSSKGGFCTMNFLFEASDGTRYIGTAGHCILGGGVEVPGREPEEPEEDKSTGPSATERVWAPGDGPEVKGTQDQVRIGEFAYAVLEGRRDFALIRLDPDVEASPEMAHFGGPTGINEDLTDDPVVLEFYGQSPGLGTLVPARTMIAVNMPNPDEVYANGPGAPGDSGSGVISADGRAVGVLVTGGIHTGSREDGPMEFGVIGLTRIGPQMRRAAEVLGVGLELVTAG
jgi:hypothetical protein